MKDSKKRKNLLLTALLLIGCFAVGLVGGTLAYYKDEQTLNNPFTVGSAQVSLNEDFNPLSSFLPGETVDKIAHFENEGKMDLFLRVYDPVLTAAWYSQNDNGDLKVNMVRIEWGDGWPKTGTEGSEWIKIGDYFYYKKVLRAGAVTNPIIKSLKLSPDVSNDRHGPDYSDKTFYLDLRAEAVATKPEAAVAEWPAVPSVSEDGSVKWTKKVTQ